MNYKISIILPVYNVEKHIIKALKSIEQQTIGLDNLQVIMVDDLSTDNSGKIIDEYAKKHDNFIAVHLDENSGAAGKPRNVGMELAKADYIMFLDPDDYYSVDACQVLYDKIISENVDMVFGYYANYRNGKPLNYKKPFGKEKEVKVNRIHEETKLLTIPPSIWTKIFKNSFIKEKNITFPEGIPGQDFVFVVNALLAADGIIFLNDFIVCHRNVRDGDADKSITYTLSAKYLMGLLKAYNYSFEIYTQYNCEDYILTGFQTHILFWMRKMASREVDAHALQLFSEAAPLFRKLQDHGLYFEDKKWEALFNFVSNEKFDEAFILREIIQDSVKKESKLRKNLKIKKNKVAKLQTTKGWMIYKSKNILKRLKNKF